MAKKREGDNSRFLLVREDAVPEVYRKVLSVKERLERELQLSVNQACKEEGISRSAFYKYREHIHVYHDRESQVQLSFFIEAEFSAKLILRLSEVLQKKNAILKQAGQTMPRGGYSILSITVLVSPDTEPEALMSELKKVQGVRRVIFHDYPPVSEADE